MKKIVIFSQKKGFIRNEAILLKSLWEFEPEI